MLYIEIVVERKGKKMTDLGHQIEVYPFAYQKIINGHRKIDFRPYKKNLHGICIGDKVEYVNIESKNVNVKEVKGIALFDDFETLIEMLDHKLIGYDSKEEIKVRVERMYSKEDIEEYGVVAFFIDEPKAKKMMRLNVFDRCA